jgi:hypothetical protein
VLACVHASGSSSGSCSIWISLPPPKSSLFPHDDALRRPLQLLTVGALHAFSPLLRSLTYSFSNDTVFALTVSCFTVSLSMTVLLG